MGLHLRCAFLSAALLACAAGRSRPAPPGPREPFHLAAETLAGERVDVGGPGPVRLVELWASWCGPCGPAAERARAALEHHPDVVAYAISIDTDRAALGRAAAASPPPGMVLVLPGGPAAAASRGLDRIPAFLALDADGLVVGMVTGMTPHLAQDLDDLLRRAEGRGHDRG
jgi:hypothetical protein